jgi:hypothetical protein
MNIHITALERAFQLAKTGAYASVQEIKRQVSREGFSADQITGRSLSKQLSELIRKSRAKL